jgi:hypothetical protein
MRPKKKMSERWRRAASDAALVSVYAGVVLTLFGSFAFEHVTRSAGIQIALVSSAIAVLVVSGIWLDRREARHEGAVSEE